MATIYEVHAGRQYVVSCKDKADAERHARYWRDEKKLTTIIKAVQVTDEVAQKMEPETFNGA